MISRLLLKFWLLPPAINILLVVAGLLLLRRYRNTGLFLVVLGLVSLWLLAMPPVANGLLASLERDDYLFDAQRTMRTNAAIVVLGSGSRGFAREYADFAMDSHAVARLNYAVFLHRQTGLPLLLSGGVTRADRPAQAELMSRYLLRNFGVQARWLEGQSLNTEQNAKFSAEILRREDVGQVLLVTQASHMRRSVELYQRQGLEVVPAATQLSVDVDMSHPGAWLPDTASLDLSRRVLHEYLGLAWYAFPGN